MVNIDQLAFSYGSTPVLNNITMRLAAGRIYGLLVENGVGKTTLLTLLAGLKKPQQGTIEINGENPYERHPDFLSTLYYLPDEVAPLNETARQFATRTGIFWPGFSRDTFVGAMKEFDTDPAQKMNRMSAGQLKKTYISFALASGATLILMDEPTNGLDIPSKSQFRSAIMKYTREDATIVISTHQVRDLENIIDPIIILDRRDVLLNATIEQIADKLYFDYGTTLHPEALYSEQLPGGFIQVLHNPDKADSKVNIEALFNTVHKHKDLVKNLFCHE